MATLDRDSEFKSKKKSKGTPKEGQTRRVKGTGALEVYRNGKWINKVTGKDSPSNKPTNGEKKESNLPPKNGKEKKGDDRFKKGGKSKFPTDAPGDLSKTKEKPDKTNGNGKTNKEGGTTNGDGGTTKPPQPTKEAVWDSEKFRWVIPQDKTEKTDKPNKEKLKEKTAADKGPVADADEYGETLKEEKGKRDKAAADKQAAADAVEAEEKKKWLDKTKNSPAARAGFNSEERWSLQKKHRQWKSDKKSGKLKEDRKKKRKPYGAMGRGQRR